MDLGLLQHPRWSAFCIITKHSILDVAAALDPPLVSEQRFSISGSSSFLHMLPSESDKKFLKLFAKREDPLLFKCRPRPLRCKLGLMSWCEMKGIFSSTQEYFRISLTCFAFWLCRSLPGMIPDIATLWTFDFAFFAKIVLFSSLDCLYYRRWF